MEAIFAGQVPDTLSLKSLKRDFPVACYAQCTHSGIRGLPTLDWRKCRRRLGGVFAPNGTSPSQESPKTRKRKARKLLAFA